MSFVNRLLAFPATPTTWNFEEPRSGRRIVWGGMFMRWVAFNFKAKLAGSCLEAAYTLSELRASGLTPIIQVSGPNAAQTLDPFTMATPPSPIPSFEFHSPAFFMLVTKGPQSMYFDAGCAHRSGRKQNKTQSKNCLLGHKNSMALSLYPYWFSFYILGKCTKDLI